MRDLFSPHTWSFTTCIGETDRVHIWTFEANHAAVGCGTAPSFVENDYFCDRGNPGTFEYDTLYASNPLWDGQGGESSPPEVTALWFCKQLPQTTTNDIEIRICGNQANTDEGTADEDTPVEIIELYIR